MSDMVCEMLFDAKHRKQLIDYYTELKELN